MRGRYIPLMDFAYTHRPRDAQVLIMSSICPATAFGAFMPPLGAQRSAAEGKACIAGMRMNENAARGLDAMTILSEESVCRLRPYRSKVANGGLSTATFALG
jgi:hypothetical protein